VNLTSKAADTYWTKSCW